MRSDIADLTCTYNFYLFQFGGVSKGRFLDGTAQLDSKNHLHSPLSHSPLTHSLLTHSLLTHSPFHQSWLQLWTMRQEWRYWKDLSWAWSSHWSGYQNHKMVQERQKMTWLRMKRWEVTKMWQMDGVELELLGKEDIHKRTKVCARLPVLFGPLLSWRAFFLPSFPRIPSALPQLACCNWNGDKHSKQYNPRKASLAYLSIKSRVSFIDSPSTLTSAAFTSAMTSSSAGLVRDHHVLCD